MTRSRYDELHDRFHPFLSGKAGTRYERLAALVWKALNNRDAVVHDIKVTGESDVAHQIDVTIDREGRPHRVLVECKDFDIAQEKVGLDIVRSFRAVLEDTKANEGFIITCVGFTRDAQKYAKAKEIKLIVLRAFNDADWAGRIKTIVLNLHAIWIENLQVKSLNMSQSARDQFVTQLAEIGLVNVMGLESPVYFVRGSEKKQFNEFMAAAANAASAGMEPGPAMATVQSDGWMLTVNNTSPLQFDNVELTFDVKRHSTVHNITTDRIAELLLSGFGSDDLIIFSDQLERYTIDPTGEVQVRSS